MQECDDVFTVSRQNYVAIKFGDHVFCETLKRDNFSESSEISFYQLVVKIVIDPATFHDITLHL